MRRMASLAAALLLLAVPAVGQSGEGYATVTLENGASIGFGLLRTGEAQRAPTLGEAALPRSNAVRRVLWDRDSGAYFGYRVEVTREEDAFRVAFGPLDDRRIPDELRAHSACPECPAPVPLDAPTPRFPVPQRLGEGEALTLELLANPTTGERIFDVVKVSARPIPGAELEAAVERARAGQAILLRAAAHVARGRYRAAADAFGEALKIFPRDAVVHNKLAICYQKIDNHFGARREYERALALNPDYAEVWNNIGTLHQSTDDLEDAVKAYREAIRIKPDLATAWKNLGNAYLALDRPKEAFEAYGEAFRLDPTILETQGLGIPAGVDAAMPLFYLAKLLAANGNVDEAFEFLTRAREAGFDDFNRVRSDPDFLAVVEDERFQTLFGE